MDILTERTKLNVSQAELATRLGLHQTTVHRWEKEDLIPKPRDIFAIRAALDAIAAERATSQRKAS